MDEKQQSDYTKQKELEINMTQNDQNRTSFLIEDILYRQKNEPELSADKSFDCFPATQAIFKPNQFKYDNDKHFQTAKPMEKRVEKSPYGYFQSNVVQGGLNSGVQGFQPTENGYIQVMGALGAYLGTPYKTMSDPYFLTQGN